MKRVIFLWFLLCAKACSIISHLYFMSSLKRKEKKKKTDKGTQMDILGRLAILKDKLIVVAFADSPQY